MIFLRGHLWSLLDALPGYLNINFGIRLTSLFCFFTAIFSDHLHSWRPNSKKTGSKKPRTELDSESCTLSETNILSRKLTYPPDKAYLKMMSLFPRWDMLISWGVAPIKINGWNMNVKTWVWPIFRGKLSVLGSQIPNRCGNLITNGTLLDITPADLKR